MMKRYFFTLLAGIMVTGVAIGADRDRTELVRGSDFSKQEIMGEFVYNGKTFKVVAPPHYKDRIMTRDAAATTPLITEAPGKQNYYCKDVVGYSLAAPFMAYGVASYINRDGNEYYFYDIITGAPMGTYVKAHIFDGELVLPMTQTVFEFDDEEYSMNLGLLRPIFTESEGNVYVWFEYSDDYDYMVYQFDDNNSLTLMDWPAKYTTEGNPNSYYGFPNYVIGYYYNDDYSWSGYCDVFQAYDEFNYEPVTLPEGLDMYTLTYINSEMQGVIVSVGETEDAVYVKGLSAYAPDAVFKADIVNDGTQLAVEPNQFIGIEENVYFIVTSTVCIDKNGQLDIAPGNPPAYFDITRDNVSGKINSITAVDSENFLAFNDDALYFYPMDVFKGISLTLQEEFPGVPATPYDAYYENYADLMGANFVFFRLSSFADNGDIIDINNLYYSIFLDGQAVEFEETTGFNMKGEEWTMYPGIKEATELVPYTFANSIDLYEDSGGTFVVGLYQEGYDTVGVQGVYIDGDKVTRGGLLTIDVATGQQTITPGDEAGIPVFTSGEVVKTEYYDLQGRKILNPEKGIYLVKSIMADGTVKTRKVMK